jgi:hypothetical protein
MGFKPHTETWNSTKRNKSKIKTMNMKCLRNVEGKTRRSRTGDETSRENME